MSDFNLLKIICSGCALPATNVQFPLKSHALASVYLTYCQPAGTAVVGASNSPVHSTTAYQSSSSNESRIQGL